MASVDVDADGLVTGVDVLESPDKAVAEEVHKAVEKWTFAPIVLNGVAISTRGKLTFYFRIRGGDASVLQPHEMPTLGRR